MLIRIAIFLLQAAADFLAVALLARFLMQWRRAPFRNSLGRFVTKMTDWILAPTRRIIPSAFGLDLPSLVLILLVQLAYLWVAAALTDMLITAPIGFAMLGFHAVFEILRLFLWLIIGIGLISWINPHSAVSTVLGTVLAPFFAPFKNRLSIAGFDLSPMLFLLTLQIILMLLDWLRTTLFPILFFS